MIRAVTAATEAKGVGSLLAAAAVALCLAACGGGGSHHEGEGSAPASRTGREFYGVISRTPSSTAPRSSVSAGAGSAPSGSTSAGDSCNRAAVLLTTGRSTTWSSPGAALPGIRVLATVYGSAIWAEPSPSTRCSARPLPGFTSFVRAAVARYGSGRTSGGSIQSCSPLCEDLFPLSLGTLPRGRDQLLRIPPDRSTVRWVVQLTGNGVAQVCPAGGQADGV